MLDHCISFEAATVVKKVAPYVRRPFTNNCFNKIGSVTFSFEASSAISALISSEPKY
jgi:hypothetical protein